MNRVFVAMMEACVRERDAIEMAKSAAPLEGSVAEMLVPLRSPLDGLDRRTIRAHRPPNPRFMPNRPSTSLAKPK